MTWLIAFLVGAVVTFVEIASKYERAPRHAIINRWALSFVVLNGLAGALAFYLVQDVDVLAFNLSNPYLRAFIIGLEWQVIVRTKVFSIGGGAESQEIQVGLEYFYRRYARFFEVQIDTIEENCVLKEISRILSEQELTDQDVRERAINFIKYRHMRNKITKSEADERTNFIRRSKASEIMYMIFEMSNLSSLKTIFSSTTRVLVPSPAPENMNGYRSDVHTSNVVSEAALEANRVFKLSNLIDLRFSDQELRTLCTALNVDYDNLPGEGKADKARELVVYLDRRDRISDLITIGKRLRPDVSWE